MGVVEGLQQLQGAHKMVVQFVKLLEEMPVQECVVHSSKTELLNHVLHRWTVAARNPS